MLVEFLAHKKAVQVFYQVVGKQNAQWLPQG